MNKRNDDVPAQQVLDEQGYLVVAASDRFYPGDVIDEIFVESNTKVGPVVVTALSDYAEWKNQFLKYASSKREENLYPSQKYFCRVKAE